MSNFKLHESTEIDAAVVTFNGRPIGYFTGYSSVSGLPLFVQSLHVEKNGAYVDSEQHQAATVIGGNTHRFELAAGDELQPADVLKALEEEHAIEHLVTVGSTGFEHGAKYTVSCSCGTSTRLYEDEFQGGWVQRHMDQRQSGSVMVHVIEREVLSS